jgi:hypothetical protein
MPTFVDNFLLVLAYAGCTQAEIEYEKRRSRIDPDDPAKGMKPDAIICFAALADDIREKIKKEEDNRDRENRAKGNVCVEI